LSPNSVDEKTACPIKDLNRTGRFHSRQTNSPFIEVTVAAPQKISAAIG
jgi:hypothetical protein